MKKIFLTLLFISQAQAIDFKDGKYISERGTKKETIVYQQDTVKWFLATVASNGTKSRTALPKKNQFQMSEDLFCKVAYETQPTGDEMLGKMNVRSKVLNCEFKSNQRKIDFHTLCFLDEKKSVPMESFGKVGKPGSMYLDCEPKLLR